MNPPDFNALNNAIPYLNSPDFLEAYRLSIHPDFLEPHNSSIKASEASTIQSADILPEALAAEGTAISALKGVNIAHINSFLSQLDHIPTENFEAIKQTVTQNRSKIRDAAKANYETASDIVKKASESNADETLALPISISELIADIDDSIEFPEPDADKKVRIPLSWRGAIKVVAGAIGLAGSIVTLYEFLSKIILN